MKTILSCLLLLLLSVPAMAGQKKPCEPVDTCLRNPDGRTSITVTGGMGSLDGMMYRGDADLKTLGVALVYPAGPDFSLLAEWRHSEAEWLGNDMGKHSSGLVDWDADLLTFGFRLYIGR